MTNMKVFYTLFILLMPIIACSQIPNYVPQDGLLGWWPFTGNANDLTANNNNGVVYDAFLTSDRFSYFNRAYNFQGNNDDVIIIPTSSSLSEMTDDFTISFWFYANDGSSGHLVDRDVCQFNPDWSFVWQSNQVVFRTSNNFYYSGLLPINNWHHIVATRENGNFNLYANNSLSSSAFFNYAFTNTNAVIKIGDQSCSGTSPNFNGKIDDIGFWDRALTTNELSNVFDPCQSVTNATDTQVHCDTYTWIDGETYYSSNNTATFTFINANNCDSVVTLDLTINQSASSHDTIIACESFDWNGVTYTESGVYIFNTTDANSCDSIAKLNLTINNSDNTSSSVIVCDEFTWDGITYTESSEYTNTYTNINGCDSTHTLNLTINYTSFGTDTQEHCDTYTWIDEITYTESNNTATFTLTNANNCDSIVTLDLLITESSSSYDTVVVCDSYDWNGNTYTESGNYMYSSTNTIGCDSSANLNLSISQLENLVIDGEQIGYTESENNTYSISNSIASSSYLWSLSNNVGTIDGGNANNSEITISWGENDSETTLCVYEQDDYSCEGEESCITIDVKRPTSIDDIEESLLSIYPNPFKNQTTVSFSNPTQSKAILKLIDSRGRTARNYDGITGDSIIIKKEELSEGLYYIQLNLNNNVIRKPIVIQ